MRNSSNSVLSAPIVSDERIRNSLRRHYDVAVNIRRTTTREQLATDSGVKLTQIDAIMSQDVAKQRRLKIEDAFSIAATLGESAVNSLIAEMGYTGARRIEVGAPDYSNVVCDALKDMAVIADALADLRIDHHERRPTGEAVDHLIATVLPLSSAVLGS